MQDIPYVDAPARSAHSSYARAYGFAASFALAVLFASASAPAAATPGQTVAEYKTWANALPGVTGTKVTDPSGDGELSLDTHGTTAGSMWTIASRGVASQTIQSETFSVLDAAGKGTSPKHDGSGDAFATFSTVYGPDISSDFTAAKFIRSDTRGGTNENVYLGTKFGYIVTATNVSLMNISYLRAFGYLDPPIDEALMKQARTLLAAVPHLTMYPPKPNQYPENDFYTFGGDNAAGGYFVQRNVFEGKIATGQTVLIVPLANGGARMALSYALMWATVDGTMQFVGYVPVPFGSISIENGLIAVSTPVYTKDVDDQPSADSVDYDTLNGITLVKVRTAIEKRHYPQG